MLVINTSGKPLASVKPLKAPIVRVISQSERISSENERTTCEGKETTDAIHASLAADLRGVLVAREQLSATIAPVVRAYMDHKTPITKLEQLYDEIEQLTQQGSRIYEQIDHYERYGELPQQSEEKDPLDTENIYELKVLKRSIENRRSKFKKNIEQYHAKTLTTKNPHKILEWETKKIELDEQYDEVCQRLKGLANG